MDGEEPSVTSSDRDQRILARRKRVEDKIAAMKRTTDGAEVKEKTAEEVGMGRVQVIESKKKVLRQKKEGDEETEEVKHDNMKREAERRAFEERARQELKERLLVEAEESADQNTEVASLWSELFQFVVPQELHQRIQDQREMCGMILKAKESLVQDLKNLLKQKDDSYIKLLKRQSDDIDTLLRAMAKEHKDLEATCREEIERIESAYLQERDEQLDGYKHEIQQLLARRFHLEQSFLERMQESQEAYAKALEDLRIQEAEDYNLLKVKLETDIQNLEQHLETMRATYQLNTEKLEYNYRVLVERDHENQSTIHQQKRKIARLRDLLSSLKARHSEMEKHSQDDNVKLTEEYKRVTELFKDLQSKFKHFEQVDTKKYQEVWQMNDREVGQLVRKVLQADKIIHEQQLGWDWQAPSDELFRTPWEEIERDMEDVESESFQGSESEASSKMTALVEKAMNQRYMDMIYLLRNEASFLIDAKSRKLLDGVPEADRMRKEIECILKTLSVEDDQSLETLLDSLAAKSVFAKSVSTHAAPSRQHRATNTELDQRSSFGSRKQEVQQSVAAASGALSREQDDDAASVRSRGGDGESKGDRGTYTAGPTNRAGPTLVHPDEVVERLRIFVQKNGSKQTSAATRMKLTATAKMIRASQKAQERERRYWERLGAVISPKVFRVWQALEGNLQKYLKVLEGREADLRAVKSLRQQNGELRALLDQYLSSKVNEQLVVPPSQLI